ncbi:hypothetical protein [Lentilactobacillus sp. Marseille-Q4993]|uniref:hypothetical protein n=1 Tax=Lentilactobacillus sp. Marseille-Q4993 TaxID=3039492 RepID=UPI0024BC916D|nr:hypothetical protein [Lentilactobacillus sp. Marseille-Q4993]
MKKTTGIFIGALAMALFAIPAKPAHAGDFHRIKSSFITNTAKPNQYYRYNQNTQAGPFKGKKIILPKGTIISGFHSGDSASKTLDALQNMGPDLSYYLLKKQGFAKPWHQFNTWQTYMKSRYTRVKTPSYMVTPYNNNVFVTGGPAQFKDKAINGSKAKLKQNAIKFTSDGFAEFYKYKGKQLVGYDGRWLYRQKPTSFAKIRKTIRKNGKIYFYFRNNLKGVNDKKVRSTGNYRYRLTIQNLHTPYEYVGRSTQTASMYKFGGYRYYTLPIPYQNNGD